MMEFLEPYIDIQFVLAIIFATEALNAYVPLFKKINNRWGTLLVAVIMIFVFYNLRSPENTKDWMIRILVSFLGAVGMYDFLVKPIKKKIISDKIKKELNQTD